MEFSPQSIREEYEKLKKIFCPECKHLTESKHCPYLALCFLGYLIKKDIPSHFDQRTSNTET